MADQTGEGPAAVRVTFPRSDVMTPKALVVAPMPYYLEKGSTLRAHAMVERLREAGYDVDVACYNRGTDPGTPGVRVFRAGIRRLTTTDAGPAVTDLLNDLFVALRVLRLVWRCDYALLQGEDVEGFVIVLLAGLLSDAEAVYDLHNPLSATLEINEIPIPPALTRWVEGGLYRRADRVIANWGTWADAIETEYGITDVETIYDSVPGDVERIPLPADRYVTYVGNFEHYQGVDLLVTAFQRLAQDTNVDLVLVGEPSDAIWEQVASSPVADRIHLLGRQPIGAANHVIANAVACVLPRRTGRQPSTKLLHYAAHDRPIVATDLACNQELRRFDNRIHWADPTADSMADALREAIRDA